MKLSTKSEPEGDTMFYVSSSCSSYSSEVPLWKLPKTFKSMCWGLFFLFFSLWELPRTASHAERLYVMSHPPSCFHFRKNLLPINQVRNINTTWAQLRGAMRGTPRQSPGRPIGGHYLAGRAWPLLVCGLHRPCKLRTQVFPFSPSLTPHLDPSPAITFSVPCCCRCGMLWSQEK